MNNKQVKRLRRLGLDTKKAKRGFHNLTHTQKQPVLETVAHIKMMEQLEENLKKLEANAEPLVEVEVSA